MWPEETITVPPKSPFVCGVEKTKISANDHHPSSCNMPIDTSSHLPPKKKRTEWPATTTTAPTATIPTHLCAICQQPFLPRGPLTPVTLHYGHLNLMQQLENCQACLCGNCMQFGERNTQPVPPPAPPPPAATLPIEAVDELKTHMSMVAEQMAEQIVEEMGEQMAKLRTRVPDTNTAVTGTKRPREEVAAKVAAKVVERDPRCVRIVEAKLQGRPHDSAACRHCRLTLRKKKKMLLSHDPQWQCRECEVFVAKSYRQVKQHLDNGGCIA